MNTITRTLIAAAVAFACAAGAQQSNTNRMRYSDYPRARSFASGDLFLISRPSQTNLSFWADDVLPALLAMPGAPSLQPHTANLDLFSATTPSAFLTLHGKADTAGTADTALAGWPTATSGALGVVRPDGTTITVNGSGVLSVVGGPGGGVNVAAGTNATATTNSGVVTISAAVSHAEVQASTQASTNGLGSAAFHLASDFDSSGAAASAQAASLPLHATADNAAAVPWSGVSGKPTFGWMAYSNTVSPTNIATDGNLIPAGILATGLAVNASGPFLSGNLGAGVRYFSYDGSGLTNLNLGNANWSQANAVTTNAVALKIPAFTNAGTVFYLILFTNVP